MLSRENLASEIRGLLDQMERGQAVPPLTLLTAMRRYEELIAGDSGDAESRGAEFELTPAMHWLREQGGPCASFHLAVTLDLPPATAQSALVAALATIVERHEMLRMQLIVSDDGRWRLVVRDAAARDARSSLTRVSMVGYSEQRLRALRRRQAAEAAARLDPEAGVVLQVVWFDGGDRRSSTLLVLIHHLAIDAVSWFTLVPELQRALAAFALGQVPSLGAAGASFRSWVQRLQADASSARRQKELDHWRSVSRDAAPLLPGADADRRFDTADTARTVTLDVPSAVYAQLPAAARHFGFAGLDDLLIAALGIAAIEWRRTRGASDADTICVDVENHGRADPEIDLSRTVGWFTSVHPVRLALAAPADRTDAGLRASLEAMGAQLRAVPGDGAGFGLLRYLNPETAPVLAAVDEPQLAFNYLGRLIPASWRSGRARVGSLQGVLDPRMRLPHILEVGATTVGTASAPYLFTTWTWAGRRLSQGEVFELGSRWVALLGTVAGLDAPGILAGAAADAPAAPAAAGRRSASW